MNNRIPTYLLIPILTLFIMNARAQDTHQVDLVDVGHSLLSKHNTSRKDTVKPKPGQVLLAALPAAGYTLQTGFAGVLSSNISFYTSDPGKTNLSTILTSVTYSQYQQIIFPVQADIWTKNNKYDIITDWRYLQYPSLTYGLGGNTSADSGYNIDYGYLRLHQAILRSIGKDVYLGLGYDLDYFWGIREIDPPHGKETDFERYGLTKTATASGISLHALYDSRRNSNNPEKGDYLSITYRPNFTWLGSDNNWSSLLFDARKYIPMPTGRHDVLAIWSYDWFTINGHPPYLLLPSTGWDAASNTGRGYIQGRYRSTDMLYLESEYRFGITANGLLGGVLFANAESFNDPGTNHYTYIQPGYGLGIRISLNKFSRTNFCLDYGWGSHGSSGFFVNLNEVF